MHSAGARALREDDNEMSREAVLLQWERKIEVAERLEDDASSAHPVPLRSDDEPARTKRFERRAPEPEAAPVASADTETAEADALQASADAEDAHADAAGAGPRVARPRAASARAASARADALRPSRHADDAQAHASGATPPATKARRAGAPAPVAQRRTITITGQPTPARRRRAVVDAQLAQPDRIALWAFLLGLLLVAVAAGTAHA